VQIDGSGGGFGGRNDLNDMSGQLRNELDLDRKRRKETTYSFRQGSLGEGTQNQPSAALAEAKLLAESQARTDQAAKPDIEIKTIEEQHDHIGADDIIAVFAGVVAIMFAGAMIIGYLPVNAGTLAVVGFTGLPSAIFGVKQYRAKHTEE
jgi:hypothetical protein